MKDCASCPLLHHANPRPTGPRGGVSVQAVARGPLFIHRLMGPAANKTAHRCVGRIVQGQNSPCYVAKSINKTLPFFSSSS